MHEDTFFIMFSHDILYPFGRDIFYFLVLFVTTQASPYRSNYANKFVFAFPPNGDPSTVLELHMTTYEKKVSVHIKCHLRNSEDVPHAKVNVNRGVVTVYRLPAEIARTGTPPGGAVQVIVSGGDIVLLAMSSPNTMGSEGFLIWPEEALSTKYCFSGLGKNEIACAAVVATEDTEVQLIYPASQAFFRSKETIFSMPLSSYEAHVFQIGQSLDVQCIVASKPVAVIIGSRGNDQSRERHYGQKIEMLVPTDNWGTRSVIAPLDINTGQKSNFVITPLATVSATLQWEEEVQQIKIFSSKGHQGNIGATINRQLVAVSVRGQRPHGVVVCAPNSGPAISIVPPVEQFRSDYLFIVPKSPRKDDFAIETRFTSNLTVIIEKIHLSGLVLDTARFTDTLKREHTMATCDKWVSVTNAIKPGVHLIYHRKAFVKFGAFLYGVNQASDAYATPAGMQLSTLKCLEKARRHEPGDGVDNDCDGRVDEEADNSEDDDMDGRIDEDVVDMRRDYMVPLLDKMREAVNTLLEEAKVHIKEPDVGNNFPVNGIITVSFIGAFIAAALIGSGLYAYKYIHRRHGGVEGRQQPPVPDNLEFTLPQSTNVSINEVELGIAKSPLSDRKNAHEVMKTVEAQMESQILENKIKSIESEPALAAEKLSIHSLKSLQSDAISPSLQKSQVGDKSAERPKGAVCRVQALTSLPEETCKQVSQ